MADLVRWLIWLLKFRSLSVITARLLASLLLNRDRELRWVSEPLHQRRVSSVSSWVIAIKMLASINKVEGAINKIFNWIQHITSHPHCAPSPSSSTFPPQLPFTVGCQVIPFNLLNLSLLPEPTSCRHELHTRSFSSSFIQSVDISQENTLCWPSNQEAASRWAPCPSVSSI